MERFSRIIKSVAAAAALALCCVPSAQAQNSKLLLGSSFQDISADGNTVVGTLLDSNVNGQLYIFTRGSAPTIVGPSLRTIDGRILLTDDKAFITCSLPNGSFGPQNPAFGYYGSSVVCCVGSVCSVVASPQACAGTIVAGTGTCTSSTPLCPRPASPPAIGSCCNPNSGLCTVTTQPACPSPNYWMGAQGIYTCESNPCKYGHFVGHRLNTTTAAWQNIGAFPNVGGTGASVCDASMANNYGVSSTGQFMVGYGLYGPYGATGCNGRGYVWNATDNIVRNLPPTGTGSQIFSQAEFVTTDGLTVVGTDSIQVPQDPAGLSAPVSGSSNGRTLTVWERATPTADFLAAGRTRLDRFGGAGLGSMAMTPSGVIVADLSDEAANYDFLGACCKTDNSCVSVNKATCGTFAGATWNYNVACTPALCPLPAGRDLRGTLMRYVKISGVWTPQIIGRVADRSGFPSVGAMFPRAISNDGNTVVGTAIFGGKSSFFSASRTFIWKAGFNGGVPVDFADYVAGINGGTFPPTGSVAAGGQISGDGNALLVTWAVPPPAVCGPNAGLSDISRSGVLYLDGTNVGCEPPRIIGGPYSVAQKEYTQFGIVGNVFFTGSYPISSQWQKEVPSNSNNWVNITDSCGQFGTTPGDWIYEGTNGFQLRVNMLATPAERDGRYRVILTNPCGSATSNVANVSVISGACCYVQGGQTLCSIELPSRCTQSNAISFFFGGTYLGDNTVCGPTTCSSVSGACCVGAGGSNANCVIAIQPYCLLATADGGLGGTYAGNETTCSPTTCGSVSGACCYSPNNTSPVICTQETSGFCVQRTSIGGPGGVYRGTATTCTPTQCNAVAGACCYAASTTTGVICTIQTGVKCAGELRNGGLQGIYVGNGEVCSPADLCSAASGACCYTPVGATEAICTIQLQQVCTFRVNGQFENNNSANPLIIGLGGVYRGDGTTCGPTSCTSFIGACCYTPSGQGQCPVCITAPNTRCTSATNIGGLAGTWAGAGTVCGAVPPCSLGRGACCVFGSCVETCLAECTANSGTFTANVTCSPDPCAPALVVCCRGTMCVTATASACLPIPGVGVFSGTATTCNASGTNTSPCCYADFDKNGSRSIDDIFIFLNAWFAPATNPYTKAGGDGTTNANIDDIFIFLNVWFAGGCG